MSPALNRSSAINGEKRLKKTALSHGHSYFPDPNSPTIINVPLTRSHFLDAYSKGKWNLSNIPCPSCFQDTELFCPPKHYNEISRLNSIKKLIYCEQWNDRSQFQKLIAKALKQLKVTGASISLLNGDRQIVKYQTLLNITECPRRISIDAHTILSDKYFLLEDASKDWRTCKNPFVVGSPHIKFYCAVPLITKFGAVIGAFAVFDPVPKKNFDLNLVKNLRELADDVLKILNTPVKESPLAVTNSTPLIKIIGRPTSQACSLANSALYEKDGSGSQYLQNHIFRYSKQRSSSDNSGHKSIVQERVNKELPSIRDMKLASKAISKIISEVLQFDYVCVVEIRVSQCYKISNEFFPKENRIDAESFKNANKLIRVEDEQMMTRTLGSFGSFDLNPIQHKTNLYYGALSSEFGIYYENVSKANIKFKAGICMPFYRIPSKIIRKRKIIRNEKASRVKPIDVYLRSGGFLIAAFNKEESIISEDNMNDIYGVACTLRRVFI